MPTASGSRSHRPLHAGGERVSRSMTMMPLFYQGRRENAVFSVRFRKKTTMTRYSPCHLLLVAVA